MKFANFFADSRVGRARGRDHIPLTRGPLKTDHLSAFRRPVARCDIKALHEASSRHSGSEPSRKKRTHSYSSSLTFWVPMARSNITPFLRPRPHLRSVARCGVVNGCPRSAGDVKVHSPSEGLDKNGSLARSLEFSRDTDGV